MRHSELKKDKLISNYKFYVNSVKTLPDNEIHDWFFNQNGLILITNTCLEKGIAYMRIGGIRDAFYFYKKSMEDYKSITEQQARELVENTLPLIFDKIKLVNRKK